MAINGALQNCMFGRLVAFPLEDSSLAVQSLEVEFRDFAAGN